MRPGNCSGSYSEPPRAREIALRSSSCPREVDATTFSIRYLAMGPPPGPELHKPAPLEGNRRHAVPYMVRCARGPPRLAETASAGGVGPPVASALSSGRGLLRSPPSRPPTSE